jgi:hypothetical protein
LVAASFLVSQLVGLRVREIERLQYAVVLVGISYGATYGLLPIIVIEWFGIGLCSFCSAGTAGTDSSFFFHLQLIA